MLAKAKAMTADPAVIYELADLGGSTCPRVPFDLAYRQFARLSLSRSPACSPLSTVLTPGGRLVAIDGAPDLHGAAQSGMVSRCAEGRHAWPLDSYQIEGPRTTNWLAQGVVKQHRTLGTTPTFDQRRLRVRHVEEWGPDDGQLAAQPELAEGATGRCFLHRQPAR